MLADWQGKSVGISKLSDEKIIFNSSRENSKEENLAHNYFVKDLCPGSKMRKIQENLDISTVRCLAHSHVFFKLL